MHNRLSIRQSNAFRFTTRQNKYLIKCIYTRYFLGTSRMPKIICLLIIYGAAISNRHTWCSFFVSRKQWVRIGRVIGVFFFLFPIIWFLLSFCVDTVVRCPLEYSTIDELEFALSNWTSANNGWYLYWTFDFACTGYLAKAITIYQWMQHFSWAYKLQVWSHSIQ